MLQKTKLALLILAATASAFSIADPVAIQTNVPYAADAKIAQNIRNECTKLGSQLATFTQDFGKKSGVAINLVENLNTTQPGRVLQLEITDAVSKQMATMDYSPAFQFGHPLSFELATRFLSSPPRAWTMCSTPAPAPSPRTPRSKWPALTGAPRAWAAKPA